METPSYEEQMTAGRPSSPAGQARHPARGLGVNPDDPHDRRGRRRRVGAGVDRERPSCHLRLLFSIAVLSPVVSAMEQRLPLEPEAVRRGARAGDRDRSRGGRAGGDAGDRRRSARLQRRPATDRRRGQSERPGQLDQRRERLARRWRSTRARSRAESPRCRAGSPTSASRPSAR